MEVFNLFNLLLPKVLTMLLLLPKVLTILQQVVLFNRVVIPMDLQQLLHRVLTVLQQVVQSNQVVIPMDLQPLLLRALTVLPPLPKVLTTLQPAVQSKQVIPTDPQQLLLRALTVLQSPRLNPTTENNGNFLIYLFIFNKINILEKTQ